MYWDNRTKQKLLALYEGELDRKTTIQKELKKLPGGKLTVKQNRVTICCFIGKMGAGKKASHEIEICVENMHESVFWKDSWNVAKSTAVR